MAEEFDEFRRALLVGPIETFEALRVYAIKEREKRLQQGKSGNSLVICLSGKQITGLRRSYPSAIKLSGAPRLMVRDWNFYNLMKRIIAEGE